MSIQERVHARTTTEDVAIDLKRRQAGLESGPGSCTRGRVAWYAFEAFASFAAATEASSAANRSTTFVGSASAVVVGVSASVVSVVSSAVVVGSSASPPHAASTRTNEGSRMRAEPCTCTRKASSRLRTSASDNIGTGRFGTGLSTRSGWVDLAGADSLTRTDDLPLTRRLLYHLS